MEIRYITPEEAPEFQKVSASSFIWKFDPEVDDHVDYPVLAAFNNGKIISGAEAVTFKSNYCGHILNAIGISGICTLPEKRRSGSVRAIFDKIGSLALENDWAFGILCPFSVPYYEKFGYAHLNRMFSIKVPFANLCTIPRNTDAELYTGEQFEELSELHNKCALKENLQTLRGDKKFFCDTPLENADYTYIHRNSSGEADGYVRFTISRPNDLNVKDLFALGPEALYSLIGFLRNYDGIVKNLIVKQQYQGSAFSCIADRFSDVSYDFGESPAARIYNMQKILESNCYPKEYGRFRLKCIDDLPQNSGIFEVEYQNGKSNVTKTNDGDYDISLSPPAAARLLLAGEGHNAETAVYIAGTEIKGNADDFFRAFPYRQTRFSDYF